MESSENESSEKKGSSWFMSSLIVVNAVMGAGMLNFPWAFNKAGSILIATILHVIFLLFAGASLLALGWCSDGVGKIPEESDEVSLVTDDELDRSQDLIDPETFDGEESDAGAEVTIRPALQTSKKSSSTSRRIGADSFQEGVGVWCGVWVRRGSSLCVAIYMYLASVTYIVVVGDQTDRIFYDKIGHDFCETWYLNRKFVMTVGGLLFVLPFCYSKKIDFLKYASSVATIGIVYIVGITIYVYAITDKSNVHVKTWPDDWTDVFIVIPSICFSYQCHVSVIPVYSCIVPHNLWNFAKAVGSALTICFASYSIVGILGLLTFGDRVEPDILSSYNTNDWGIALGFIMFAIKNLLTVPVLYFCGTLALTDLYVEMRGLSPEEAKRNDRLRRGIIVTIWFITGMGLAIFVPNISAVIDYLGCFAAAFIFILPGLSLFMASVKPSTLNHRTRRYCRWFGSVCLVFGAGLCGMILTQAFMQSSDSSSSRTIDPNDPCKPM